VHTGDDAAARVLARRCNEFSAEMIRAHPERYAGFACLPLPDVDGALGELSYALDDLELDGVVLFSNSHGVYLGDPRFTPLFDELQRRQAVVFVHPNPSPDPSAHSLGLPDSLIDFPADTTRAIAQLHYGNTLARTPDVKYVFSHAGGTVPYLAGRFGIVDEMNVVPGAAERGSAAETFRRLYWDTALSWGDPVLRMLREVVGLDRVVFGSDFPYLRRDLAVSCREHIETSAELTESERTAVLGGTAAELLARVARLRSQTKAPRLNPGRHQPAMRDGLRPPLGKLGDLVGIPHPRSWAPAYQAGHREASARGLTSCVPGARQNLNRSQKGIVVQAITVRDRAAGAAGLTLSDIPHPRASENDVIVRVHAAGFTPGELDWPGTWTDRAGRDRTPSVPGHELSGVVTELGYGTTGLTVGQRVFGLADWTRDGSLAQYTAVEARNLAPLPADIDYTVAAALPISGLTAWQGLFDHAGLKTGQTALIHGAAGGVGSIAVQLAHELGARVIGTGRAADRAAALGLGTDVFVDLQADRLEEIGEVDVVFDVIGGEVLERSAPLVRAGGTLVTIIGLPKVRPADGRAIFFVVEPDRVRLADLAERVRAGRLQPIIGAVLPLAEAPSAFTPDRRMPGKTIIRVTEGE
jgi:NADPH:quinone reductase-like Zn-dependent oxidoreductase/predicted TIM-barrel fold metal-dependent hydrolase